MSVILRKKQLADGRQSLYLDFYQAGMPRSFEFLNIYLDGNKTQNKERMRMADGLRAKRELECLSTLHGIPLTKKAMSFFEYAEQFRLKNSENSRKVMAQMLQHVKDFAGTNLHFNQINGVFAEKFKTFLLDEKLSPTTVNTYIQRMKTILNSAIEDGYIDTNPFRKIKVKTVETLPRYLTLDEVRLLSANECGSPIVKDAFLFSCFSGLRYSDVAKLKWSDIENGMMRVVEQKTGRSNLFPLASTAIQLIERQRNAVVSNRRWSVNQEGTVFKLPHHHVCNKVLDRWSMKAISKRITFHWGRHSFATLCLTQGIDLYTVSKLLGHKKILTTQIYARVIDSRKVEAIQRLPELGV